MPQLAPPLTRLPGRARPALLWLLTAALYAVSRRLGAHWSFADVGPTAWPGLSIVFSAAALAGPWLVTAPVVASFLETLASGWGIGVALGLAASTAAAGAATIAIHRLGRVESGAEQVRAFAMRVTAAAVAALPMAGGAVLTLAAAGRLEGSALEHLGFWALGGFTGILVVSPALRAWVERASFGVARPAERLLVVALAAALAELLSVSSFGRSSSPAYLVLPVVFWAAMRTGRRGATTVTLVVGALTLRNTAAGLGPFLADGRTKTALSLMVFLLVVSLSGLAFASLAAVREEAEERLRTREERFRAMIEKATDLLAILGPDGRILYESPSSLAILGYRPEELLGRNAFDLIHPDDRADARAAYETVFAEPGATVSAAARFRHADGNWVDLIATARNLLDDPAVGGIVVNSRDVTASRRAERELVEAERRYRTLVERLPLVTYVNGTTHDEPPRYVSPQIEEMLGYPVASWYEDPRFSYQVIHDDDLRLLDELFVEDDVDSRRAEYRMIAADGRVVWVLDHMVTIRDAAGEPLAVQGFLVDVTERKQLEEQLRSAQRMESLGLLAGGVAHDFNNLLTAIAGYGELARTHLDRPERARRDLDEVLQAADRASNLTRQLLAFGRRQMLQHEVVDLNAVVLETRPLLERLLGETVELELRLDPGLGAVRADAGQLSQVLVNLAVNARDAMPTGGRLTIATADDRIEADDGDAPPGDYVVVTVSDTGSGIDAAVREHLFEPFFTTKEIGKGTGLGLAVVHGIVEQSRGRIVVRSEPGGGAEFRILLPRTEERPNGKAAVALELPRGSETVLLVEDEEMVRRLTAEMLERQGYRVVAAGSPAEALTVEEPYELLLTDVVMPGMNGPELAERLAERRPGTAVLFTSGYSAAAVADRTTLDDCLLEKPFTLEQLAHSVRTALDRR